MHVEVTNHGFNDTQSNAVFHFVKRHGQQVQMLLWLHTAISRRT